MGQTQTKNKKKIKYKRKPEFDSREDNFIKIGSILLEKQIALSKGQHLVAGQLKVFSIEDIEKAINNYDPGLIVHSIDRRVVYKTIIEDHIVAVKVPISKLAQNFKQIDRYSTEAAMSMVMNHENMVKLYGCCLETSIPILVYEFLPNGSLFEHLHCDNASIKHINWANRLRAATDTAYALSYMHNALSKPVVHRDLNSYSILLDHSFHAKLGNFGYSVPITPGDTSQRWPLEGTPGYIDPEYIETQVVTDKSDVYSFGVLMLELLTRMQPHKMSGVGKDLVDMFVTAVKKNCMMKMIDSEVLEQASRKEIQQFAQVALTCVARERAERPTMIEVVKQLWKIQGRPDN